MVTSGQSPAPGIALTRHKEQLSILYTQSTEKLQKQPDSSLYFEHKMTEHAMIPRHYLGFNYQTARGARDTMSLIV